VPARVDSRSTVVDTVAPGASDGHDLEKAPFKRVNRLRGKDLSTRTRSVAVLNDQTNQPADGGSKNKQRRGRQTQVTTGEE